MVFLLTLQVLYNVSRIPKGNSTKRSQGVERQSSLFTDWCIFHLHFSLVISSPIASSYTSSTSTQSQDSKRGSGLVWRKLPHRWKYVGCLGAGHNVKELQWYVSLSAMPSPLHRHTPFFHIQRLKSI